MTALVDVLIPAYNAQDTVRESVQSMLDQTLRDLTVQIVDDGSTDGTPAILRDMAAADPRLIVHTRANGGIVDALNFGLTQCTAKYVARMDADDLSYPQRLAVQIAYLEAHPDVVAVGAIVRHVDGDGAPIGSFADLASPDLADADHVPCIEPYIVHPFLTARRAALVAAGGYRQVCYAEDSDLYWRLRAFGRLHNIRELLGDYRFHDGSISGRSIVNGRIMAVSSQLTGLSERRRRRAVDDIVFSKDSLAAYRRAETLDAIVELASTGLDPAEKRYLEEAAAAKLLELTSYRPYEIEAADCRFIRRIADRGFGHLPKANAELQLRRITGTAARLAANGRAGDARAMLPPSLYPAFVARTLARKLLPEALWRRVRRGGKDKVWK